MRATSPSRGRVLSWNDVLGYMTWRRLLPCIALLLFFLAGFSAAAQRQRGQSTERQRKAQIDKQKEREKLLEDQAAAKRVLAKVRKEALKDREAQLAALREGQEEKPDWKVAEIVSVESALTGDVFLQRHYSRTRKFMISSNTEANGVSRRPV